MRLREQIRRRLKDERGTLYRSGSRKVALCYPGPYHVGMSSLGFQTIYREINGHPGWAAERVFLPDDVQEHRRSRDSLVSYEGQSSLQSFPVVAFSIAYELELAGIFEVLDLARIPIPREERNSEYPLVVAGGPLTFSNAAPLEPFADVIVQGEAEELVHLLLDKVAADVSRDALLAELAEVPGFRVPAVGGSQGFVAKASDRHLPARSQIVTPNTELRSMFLVEPERGCSRGCHYCVMRRTTNGGMRTVPPERVLELIPPEATRVGLVGAAVTDHPQVESLLATIVESGRQVGVSSLRADRLTQSIVNLLKAGGARVLTVASDGMSQKIRDLVDRRHTEEQILHAAQMGRAAGMDRLKVYNMIGLPLEEDSDIEECVRFTKELSKILPVALGVAPFVAKRNTPLDGSPFAGIKEVDRRLRVLRGGLKGKADVRATSSRWAWVEYMLAQSGPEAGVAAYQAWSSGNSFRDYARSFEADRVEPYLLKRVEDGRRKPTIWPQVAS